jgi:hypothetical protein
MCTETIIGLILLVIALIGFAIRDINWGYVFKKLRRLFYGRK